jgi:type IV secretion system protein VirB5
MRWLLLILVALAAQAASAQIPVTDVGAIVQLVSQLQALEQQVETARQQLAQAQSEFQAITGGRGMERLLAGTVRNYLPATWGDIQGALVTELQRALALNTVLSDAQLSVLSPGDRGSLESLRQAASVEQVLAQQALAVTSARFASLQQLIDAIATASDQKGILDLQARIAAEQGMLQNEHAKLGLLRAAAQADVQADEVRAREQALAGHGSFSVRFQPAP